jgi:hypothetical protein
MARLIIHVGTHKTATTSIQRFFGQHRDTLAQRGLFYPGYNLIGKKSHYAHLGMVNALTGNHKNYTADEARRFFRKVRERVADYDTTVISAEPFYRHVLGAADVTNPESYWPVRMAYIEQIRDLLGEAEIVVVFRRQADYAQSLYQEHVKVTRYSKPFRDFLNDFWFHFAFLDQAKAWDSVFPGLRAMSFEKLTATGDPVAEFSRLLGLPCENLPLAARHNEAMPVDMVILKRLLQAEVQTADASRASVDTLAETLGPEVFAAAEPRSFFRSPATRSQFQASFDADNEALKRFMIQPYGADEPTFPKTFKPGGQFGDTLNAKVMQAILNMTSAVAALPPAISVVTPRIVAPSIGVVAGRRIIGTPALFTVFGDSHARFFFASKDCPMWRYGFNGRRLKISGQAIPAASIAGFRPQSSSSQTKEIIQAALPQTEQLCLAFGQVDLELGYYHRKAITQDQALTPDGFVSGLLEIYEQFVLDLDFDCQAIAVKGVNLTVLRERPFTLRYVSRSLAKNGADQQASLAALEPLIMTEQQQNALSLAFNAGLQQLCTRHGMGYFDVNAALADPPATAPGMVLANAHRPAAFDYRLADTLAVRGLHIQGLLESFGADVGKFRL